MPLSLFKIGFCIMQVKKFIKNIFPYLLLALGIYLFYKCPFKLIFGVGCPGCGLTRAFVSLLKLDIKSAFNYHPLFPVVIAVFLYLLIRKKHRFKPAIEITLLVLILVLFLIVYIYRLKYNLIP